jgi:hypothetical protein
VAVDEWQGVLTFHSASLAQTQPGGRLLAHDIHVVGSPTSAWFLRPYMRVFSHVYRGYPAVNVAWCKQVQLINSSFLVRIIVGLHCWLGELGRIGEAILAQLCSQNTPL